MPFLLKYTLREYQHIGLDWLVSLYHKHLNGILADEMGASRCQLTAQGSTRGLATNVTSALSLPGAAAYQLVTAIVQGWERQS